MVIHEYPKLYLSSLGFLIANYMANHDMNMTAANSILSRLSCMRGRLADAMPMTIIMMENPARRMEAMSKAIESLKYCHISAKLSGAGSLRITSSNPG